VSMKNLPDPGLIVRHDGLEASGLIVTPAARKLGASRKRHTDIVNGRAGQANCARGQLGVLAAPERGKRIERRVLWSIVFP